MDIETINNDRLSTYELEALKGVLDFKRPDEGVIERTADKIFRPIDRLGDAAFESKVGEQVAIAVSKVVEKINDAATWSVDTDALFQEFREAGHEPRALRDIAWLPLEDVEDVRGRLALKYRAAATAEGAVVGATGAAGLAADIPLLLAIAFRAVAEYATYYGFDIDEEAERRYALDLVATASSPTQETRSQALAHLADRNAELSAQQEIREAETVVAMQFVEKIAESLAVRLTRGKIGQAVPLVGSAIGAGFNGWFMTQVTELAEAMYRERFLMRKYAN